MNEAPLVVCWIQSIVILPKYAGLNWRNMLGWKSWFTHKYYEIGNFKWAVEELSCQILRSHLLYNYNNHDRYCIWSISDKDLQKKIINEVKSTHIDFSVYNVVISVESPMTRVLKAHGKPRRKGEIIFSPDYFFQWKNKDIWGNTKKKKGRHIQHVQESFKNSSSLICYNMLNDNILLNSCFQYYIVKLNFHVFNPISMGDFLSSTLPLYFFCNLKLYFLYLLYGKNKDACGIVA